MKIALCSDWVYPSVGGVQSHIAGLSKQLKIFGHEVVIVTKGMHDVEEINQSNETEIREIKTKSIAPIQHVIIPPNKEDLRKILKKEKFDIVHAHHAFTPTALLSINAAKKLGIPTVLTNHSISIASSSDLIWGSMSQLFFPLKKYIDAADRIIAVSQAASEFIGRFTEGKEIVVIPNGVDVFKFSQSEYLDPGLIASDFLESPTLFTVGRLSFRKGFHLLIEAMPNILRKVPDAQLYIAGKGYMMTFLKGLSNSLGLTNNVNFLGYVPDEALPWLYKNSDVFEFPSISAESFGITLIEAMAANSSIVASRIGGVPEIIDDGKNGLLFNPWDSKTLAEKTIQILENKKLSKMLGKNAYEAAKKKYDWLVVAGQIERVYRDVINDT